MCLALLLTLAVPSVAQTEEPVKEAPSSTRQIDFEARPNQSGPPVNLYGLANVVAWQAYARQGASSGYANTQLAIGVASVLLPILTAPRQPRSRPAAVRFTLTIWDTPVNYTEGLRVGVEIKNTGWHELKFPRLDQHLLMFDPEGLPVSASAVDTDLETPLRPGESAHGFVEFPPLAEGQRPKFAFENVLGDTGEMEFHR